MQMTGKDIRKFRRDLDLSQAKFAELTGYTKEHICRIEGGRYNPPMSAMVLFYLLRECPEALAIARERAGV